LLWPGVTEEDLRHPGSTRDSEPRWLDSQASARLVARGGTT
jgi:hypothetical protein